ncbi:unnamed protein product [Cyclocybe aegerita]|uniref:F-box domain-containing protein n=1 Tax=Cyclocybe aegerita TaxID=1973307 RepID=A0A8S0WAW1_CYCAE|nr:unnamed protein product [Cyclocybe aegerita]
MIFFFNLNNRNTLEYLGLGDTMTPRFGNLESTLTDSIRPGRPSMAKGVPRGLVRAVNPADVPPALREQTYSKMDVHGRSFPAELWEETFSHLTRRDLVSVVLVCPEFIGPGQSVLYRVVDLRQDDSNIAATVDLLRRRADLRARIRSVTLTTRRPPQLWEASWFPPDIFQGCVNLRSLELHGFPYDVAERHAFKNYIQHSCSALQSITLHPTRNLEPLGVLDILWASQPELELKLIPKHLYSADTLTHIAWTGSISHQSDGQYDRLLNYTFNHLISLELGSLASSDNISSLNEKVTLFIKRHPLIQHLSMGKEKSSPTFFQLDARHLDNTVLPNLRSFEGFPEHLVALFQADIASLVDLHTLSVFSNTENLSDVQGMFDVLHGQQYPQVTRLQVDLYLQALNHQFESHVTFLPQRNLMIAFADLCPNAIYISARLPPLHRDPLCSMFKSFASVETISFPHLSLSVHMPATVEEQKQFFSPLAERCRNLRQIIRRRPEYTQLPDSVYTLRRSSLGELVRVDVQQ